MKKISLLAILLALGLAGCQTTNPTLVTTQLTVVVPDAKLYRCPVLKKLPDWRTLTDVQVGQTVNKLRRNNITCKASINAIKKFMDDAKKETEPK